MLKQILSLSAMLIVSTVGLSQLNLSLLSQYQYPAARGDGSDIWGYVDQSGNEYAIMGLEEGTSIMDVSDPMNPVEVFYSPGTSTIWRDIKVWNNTAYITNEGGGGLEIIDLSNLPGPITPGDVYYYTGSTYPFSTAHNIYIDENGVGHIMGADNGVGGSIMLDLFTNPLAPTELGRYNDFYLHDGFVRGDTLWGGAINDGFMTVVDVSNPAAPVTLATKDTPSTFTHNAWLSDDGNTVFTTDEVSSAYIGAYDVSNLSNIVEIDRVQSNPGSGVIPHNVFVIGNYLVTSYYRDGVTIHDATYPSNLIEVGNYDTSPMSGDGFNGCWGVYPYLPSGIVVASDIEGGLFVFAPTYQQAAYLEGNVTDVVTTSPLNTANVQLLTTSVSELTNGSGDYQTGVATAGTFDVVFSKPGYINDTVYGVSLTNGVVTVVNAALTPLPTFTLQGMVIDGNSNPVINAQVKFENATYSNTVSTNGLGEFTISSFLNDTYDVMIGKWGYLTTCFLNEVIDSTGNPYVYQIDEGYSDNFDFDLGWTVTGNAATGDWERGEPVGTSFWGFPANPDLDSPNDCGEQAYVTGNGGGGAGSDDIDDGVTILTSPIFDLSGYVDPSINFERWFFNAGGSGTPNDSLVVELSNGVTSVIIDYAVDGDPGMGNWAPKSVNVNSIMTATSTMQLKVRAMDIPGGHLAEGGLDNFRVIEESGAGIEELSERINLYPSPFNEYIMVDLTALEGATDIEVYDLTTGRILDQLSVDGNNIHKVDTDYAKGIYLVNIRKDGVLIRSERMIKM